MYFFLNATIWLTAFLCQQMWFQTTPSLTEKMSRLFPFTSEKGITPHTLEPSSTTFHTSDFTSLSKTKKLKAPFFFAPHACVPMSVSQSDTRGHYSMFQKLTTWFQPFFSPTGDHGPCQPTQQSIWYANLVLLTVSMVDKIQFDSFVYHSYVTQSITFGDHAGILIFYGPLLLLLQ